LLLLSCLEIFSPDPDDHGVEGAALLLGEWFDALLDIGRIVRLHGGLFLFWFHGTSLDQKQYHVNKQGVKTLRSPHYVG
jgi:hypothetical protein